MATRTVKARVELDGERQYKQALSELQKGNQVLSSEMRRLQAEYKGNTESTEFLTKKGELLERQLLQQKDKVETLRQALQNAAREYGEGAAATQEWQIKLNNAEAAQYDLEHAIEENNQALNQQNQGMEQTENVSSGLSVSVQDLASQFGVKLPAGLDKALGGMKGFSVGSVAAIAGVVAVVKALIDAEKKLIELTKESAANADEILTMSKVTGLDTRTIQEMQYAAELVDVSFDTIKGSLTKLKNAQQDARDGNAKLSETFRSLGVEITNADGSLRDSEEVFYDVIDALREIDNQTERDAIAMDVFGKKAEDLNPIIEQGSAGMRAYAEEAENANYVIGEEGLAALAAVDDAYQRMQKTQDSVKNQIAVEMAPTVEKFYTSWGSLMESAGKALMDSGIIDGLGQILDAVSGLFEGVNQIIGVTLPGAEEGMKKIYPVLSTIGALLASMADAIDVIKSLNIVGIVNGDLWNALGLGYGSGHANHYQTWRMQQEGTYDQYQSYYQQKAENSRASAGQYFSSGNTGGRSGGFSSNQNTPSGNVFYDSKTGKWYDKDTGWEIPGYAAGTSNWRGGLTWVGENGPELVNLPRGSQILNAQDSRNAGGTVFNITIPAKDIKEFNDIVRIAESAAVLARMGG